MFSRVLNAILYVNMTEVKHYIKYFYVYSLQKVEISLGKGLFWKFQLLLYISYWIFFLRFSPWLKVTYWVQYEAIGFWRSVLRNSELLHHENNFNSVVLDIH